MVSVSCVEDGSLRLSKQANGVVDPRNGGPMSLHQLQRGSEMEAAMSSALVKLLQICCLVHLVCLVHLWLDLQPVDIKSRWRHMA